MRDQIYCYSDVLSPNVIYVGATPPVDDADRYEREWALNVFDPDLTMRALRRRLKGRAHGMQRDRYRCSPMEARGMAVELTTLRQKDPRYVPPSADERNLALLLAIALTLSVIVTQSVRLETAATISLTGTVLCGVVAIYSIIRARRFRQYG